MQRGKKVTLADLARSTHLLPRHLGHLALGRMQGWECGRPPRGWTTLALTVGTCGAPGGGLQCLPTALSRAMDGVTGSD